MLHRTILSSALANPLPDALIQHPHNRIPGSPSPFGMELTVARMQAKVQARGDGWTLSGPMGKMFGPVVSEVIGAVAEDQKKFLAFDPSKPAPPMITTPGGGAGLEERARRTRVRADSS